MNSKTFYKALRIFLGWIFLWPFLDKLIGLGFSTCRLEDGTIQRLCDSAWLSGGSPTTGFLTYATKGPFANFFQSLAGNPIVDWLFMIGLLGIGLALIFKKKVKLAASLGALMLLLMYISGFIPPEHNPIIDEHIIYATALLYIATKKAKKHPR